MNTMKILIGATFALLIAAVVFSIQKMRNDQHKDPNAAKIEMLERRLAQLEGTGNGSSSPQTNNNFSPNNFQPQSVPNPLEQQAADQARELEVQRLKEELAQLKDQNASTEKKVDLAEREAAALLENEMDRRKPEATRANNIVQALLMARVKNWDKENLIMEILIERPEDVSSGMILGIRRNSGIIGRVRVGTIEQNIGIADPIPGSFMGEIDIREGDELIVPPAF